MSESIQKRTIPQNNSIHLYCQQIADTLNEHGLSVKVVIKDGIEVDWSPILVKELLWRSVQQALFGKKSTTELKKTGEIDQVVDTINRHLSSRFGDLGYEFIPFPSMDSLENKLNQND